jgi:tetratricopeptide (TPR) repeat protein
LSERFPRFIACLLFALVAVHLFLLSWFKVVSVDTWWHLKQGELYVATRSLPAQDPFAFTTAGREWIKFSWVTDILFYAVYSAAGATGLGLLRIAVCFLILALLYRILRRCGVHPLVAIVLVIVSSLALRFRLFVRPEIFSFVFLVLNVGILLRLRTSGPWMASALLPVQVLWANVHPSFLFGFLCPGLALAANLLAAARLAPAWDRLRLDPPRLRALAMVTLALPFATLLNPQGLALLAFPFQQNRMSRLTAFPEWMEVWRYPGVDPVWWEVPIILAVVLIAFVVCAIVLLIWEQRLDPVGWGIVLSLGVYAIFRNRAVPYFVLAVVPFLGLAVVRIGEHLSARSEMASDRRRLERLGVITCVLLLSVSILDQAALTKRYPPGFGVAPHFFPEGAVAFLERYRLDGRVFNSYQYGGYLLWRRWPANQVFIDGRYDAVLFGEDILEAYREAHGSAETLDRLAARYGIEILLLDAEPYSRMTHIQTNPGWARVYWDPVAEVYVRRQGRYAELAAAREYRWTRSEADLTYLASYRRDRSTWVQAIAELQRAAAENPGNELAWQGLAQEYRAAGPAYLQAQLEALDRALAILVDNPATGRLHAERGEALLPLGRLDEAEAAARQALRLDARLLLPRWVLALVAEGRGAWAEAREQLRELQSRLDPSDGRQGMIREHLAAVEERLRGEGSRTP